MKIIAAMVLLLSFAMPIWAQDSTPESTSELLPLLTETFTSADEAVTFNYPEDWFVRQETGSPFPFTGFITNAQIEGGLKPGDVNILIYAIGNIDQIFNPPLSHGSTFMDVANSMRESFLQTNAQTAAVGELTVANLNDVAESASFLVEITSSENEILIVKLSDSAVAVIMVATLPGELSQWQSIIETIAASIVFTPDQANLEATAEPS